MQRPEPPRSWAAVGTSSLHWWLGLHPYSPVGAPVIRTSEAVYLRDPSCLGSPFCSALLCLRQILRLMLTSCSPPFRRGRPFRRKARSPQVRRPPFTARPPDL